MISKAEFHYFKEVNLWNLILCIIVGLFFNYTIAVLLFPTFGVFIGILVYQTFKKNEFYFYHNLGFTKFQLNRNVVVINSILALLLLLPRLLGK